MNYEIRRHASVLDAGEKIVQETRHFQEQDGSTRPGRVKEEAEDYRYFPEPDLVPVAPAREWVEELRGTLPELPTARRTRLQAEWGVTDHDMQSILNAGAVDLIVETVALGAPADQARKWWMGELARRANEDGVELGELPVTVEQVAELVALTEAGTLNDKLARQVIEGVLAGEGDPGEVVAAARPGGRQRRRPAAGGHRRRGRRVPGRRGEGARREPRPGRAADRRGHEGHARAGRRRPRARAAPGEARRLSAPRIQNAQRKGGRPPGGGRPPSSMSADIRRQRRRRYRRASRDSSSTICTVGAEPSALGAEVSTTATMSPTCQRGTPPDEPGAGGVVRDRRGRDGGVLVQCRDCASRRRRPPRSPSPGRRCRRRTRTTRRPGPRRCTSAAASSSGNCSSMIVVRCPSGVVHARAAMSRTPSIDSCVCTAAGKS